LFDMDGTIVDTEPYWIESEMRLVERDGGTWTYQDGLSVVGFALTASAQVLRERGGVKGSDEEIVAQLVAGVLGLIESKGVRWRKGALELMAAVSSAGIPCALVTMSYRNLAEAVVQQLPEGTMSTIIAGDAVTQGKPHPEPYLKAAEALGVDIRQCIGIEDSPTGVTSVESSGAHVIAVPYLLHVDAAPNRSRFTSMADISLDDLRAVCSGITIDRWEHHAHTGY
jgi:HAD superfamily hydrolase (TIGR01509 family)